MTQSDKDNMKCLLKHNINTVFNIRSAFFFQPDASNFLGQIDRFGIFDLDSIRSHTLSHVLGLLLGEVFSC